MLSYLGNLLDGQLWYDTTRHGIIRQILQQMTIPDGVFYNDMMTSYSPTLPLYSLSGNLAYRYL